MISLLESLALSADHVEKLHQYQSLVIKWQKTINLVAPSTIPHIWERHFEDSLGFVNQLADMNVKNIVDIGSGAGFPALVIAICRPDLSVTVIESDERKCIFMQTVSRETSLSNLHVINERLEKALPDIKECDLLTARALASLTDLLSFQAILKDAAGGLFAKGAQYQDEIEQAQGQYQFNCVPFENRGNPDSVLLHITHLTRKSL